VTGDHSKAEAELAHEFSVLFREGLRAMSAADPRMAILHVIGSYVTIKNLVRSMTHAFYWYPVFEQAFEQFKDPPEVSWLEAEQLSLARAGMRLLATQTDQIERQRNHRSRLAGDTRNFAVALRNLMVLQNRHDR
jgi:heme oxygenase